MVKDLGMVIDTFGPISWRVYYRPRPKPKQKSKPAPDPCFQHPDYNALLAAWPCRDCRYGGNCKRGATSGPTGAYPCCRAWVEWAGLAWSEITRGIKRAAPEMEPPKAASENQYAPIVTGAEKNVKEAQDVLLQ